MFTCVGEICAVLLNSKCIYEGSAAALLVMESHDGTLQQYCDMNTFKRTSH